VKWLADENFDNDILRGVLRRSPGLDIVRVPDLPVIYGKGDTAMLAWATANGRILLTHDLSTMIPAMRVQLEACRALHSGHRRDSAA
jgi:predicted nuclease of predicted toxin-antitoxin system